MTLRNPFSAPGAQTPNTLRRAINSAFQSIVRQKNEEQIVIKNGSSLPPTPSEGQLFLLTATDGTNLAGFYGYNGTAWRKLDG